MFIKKSFFQVPIKEPSEIQTSPGFSGIIFKFQVIPGLLCFSGSVTTLTFVVFFCSTTFIHQICLKIFLSKSIIRSLIDADQLNLFDWVLSDKRLLFNVKISSL